jgi:Domain of unknown function (DUF4440)
VRRPLFLVVAHSLIMGSVVAGQSPRAMQSDSTMLAVVDATIEMAVVRGDTGALDTLYAADFRFTHSTGEVDDRRAWLQRAAASPRLFRSRTVDSVAVEVHGPVALTAGQLTVVPLADPAYVVRYVRLYTKQGKRWELKSHRSLELAAPGH